MLRAAEWKGGRRGGGRSASEREFSFVHPTMLHAMLPDTVGGGSSGGQIELQMEDCTIRVACLIQ